MPRGNPKLTKDKVKAIYSDYMSGEFTQQDIADMYGVSQPYVSRILRRKRLGTEKPRKVDVEVEAVFNTIKAMRKDSDLAQRGDEPPMYSLKKIAQAVKVTMGVDLSPRQVWGVVSGRVALEKFAVVYGRLKEEALS